MRRSLHKASELALVAPQVVALRTLGAMAAGATPGTRDRREWSRMGTEKADAFARSIAAMNAQWMHAAFELPFVLMRHSYELWLAACFAPFAARPPNRALEHHWRRSIERVLDSGLAPIHGTAVANLRRLSRARS